MKLIGLYSYFIEKGIGLDPRGKTAVEKALSKRMRTIKPLRMMRRRILT